MLAQVRSLIRRSVVVAALAVITACVIDPDTDGNLAYDAVESGRDGEPRDGLGTSEPDGASPDTAPTDAGTDVDADAAGPGDTGETGRDTALDPGDPDASDAVMYDVDAATESDATGDADAVPDVIADASDVSEATDDSDTMVDAVDDADDADDVDDADDADDVGFDDADGSVDVDDTGPDPDASDSGVPDTDDTGDDAGAGSPVARVRLAPDRVLPEPVPAICDIIGEATRFEDVSDCAGIDTVTGLDRSANTFLNGIAWGDIDGDDDLDLFVANSTGPNGLYVNLGDGTFTHSLAAGDVTLPDARSSGATFVDYDNDGDPDLYVTQDGPNVFFENVDGVFVDVTERTGLDDDRIGAGAAWGDYDGDGDLDVYVVNWVCTDCGGDRFGGQLDRLYENLGDGTFAVADDLLGETRSGAGFGASWVDIDDDGDLDLHVVNDKGYPGDPWPEGAPYNRNMVYRNDGIGCGGWCFTEVGRDIGADLRFDSMGLATGDPDRDGDPDFYISNGAPEGLLTNDGTGRFENTADDAGVVCEGQETWGVTFFDVDNDGDEDLYVTASASWTPARGSNRLFVGDGHGRFDDASPHGAEVAGRTSLGAARADYDHDGRVDLVVANRFGPYQLFRNVAPAGDFVALRLVGGHGVNRDAVGSRVDAVLTDGTVLTRWVVLGSSMGASEDLTLHFGLGDASLLFVDIRWPDGVTERVLRLERNRISVVERSADL